MKYNDAEKILKLAEETIPNPDDENVVKLVSRTKVMHEGVDKQNYGVEVVTDWSIKGDVLQAVVGLPEKAGVEGVETSIQSENDYPFICFY